MKTSIIVTLAGMVVGLTLLATPASAGGYYGSYYDDEYSYGGYGSIGNRYGCCCASYGNDDGGYGNYEPYRYRYRDYDGECDSYSTGCGPRWRSYHQGRHGDGHRRHPRHPRHSRHAYDEGGDRDYDRR